MNLTPLINEKRIAVTMGPGGVGKTTIAALLGLQAAVCGRKTLVLTIDPAMRLAGALGLDRIPPGQHHTISIAELKAAGVPAKAPLNIAMLDTGQSLTGVITREVPNPNQRNRILEHPFFKRLCNDLAGSREYAAMEELYHLHLKGGFDFVVVDTPPTTHSMDFLEAPDRILDVLNNDGYRWLMRPALLASKAGLRVLDFSGGYVVRTLSKFTGLAFLKELASFIDMFSSLMEGFRQRAAAFKAILRSEVSAFVLITTVDPNQSQETLFLHRKLFSRDLTPAAVVANRVVPEPLALPEVPDWRQLLTHELVAGRGESEAAVTQLLAAMEIAAQTLADLAVRDLVHLDQLKTSLLNRSPLEVIYLQPEDVHDIRGLEQMRRQVFGQS